MAVCMRYLLSAALTLLVLSVSAAEVSETDDDEVLVLTDGTFQAEVQQADLILVQFYTQWCVHCHSYNQKIYSKAARLLRPHGITLAKVDIDNAPALKSRYDITQIPYLKLFRKGLAFDYQGPAEEGAAEGLVHYMLEEQAKRHLGEDPVIILTEENFDPITSATELILVELYADECSSCQRLEPHFVAAARRLRKNDPPVLLGKVKVPDQMEIAKRYELGTYPLLLMLRYGERYNYTGPRDEDGIVQYMQKQVGPSSLLLQSGRQAREFTDSRETRVIGFFSMETDAQLLNEFRDSGNLIHNDMQLGHSTDPAVAKEMGMPLESVVIFHPRHLVSQYESGFSVLPPLLPNATAASLADFLLTHARPLVGEMTRDNFFTSYRHRPMLMALYDVKWDQENIKATQYWHDLIASVAKEFHDSELAFSVADEEQFPNDLKALGLEDSGEDVAVGIYAPGPVKYRLQEELTPESLRDFISRFLSGDLPPYRNSEPAPRKNKAALVKTIVGSTFEKIVLDPKKSVVVMLCSPVVPNCQKASQWYPKVAKKFEGVTDLVFGEMNAALNDPPVGTTYDTLPAIFFSKLGSREMEAVEPRPEDAADLTSYLKRRQNIKPMKASKKGSKKSKDKPSKGKKGKASKGKKGKASKKKSKTSKKDEL